MPNLTTDHQEIAMPARRSASSPPTYRQWMRRYAGADNKYGDTAGELVDDTSWPDDITTTDEMEEYLAGLGVAESFRAVVIETFEQYRTDTAPEA